MAQNEKTLYPAYLIVGEDELKRQRTLELLNKRLAEYGDLEFNLDQFDGETAQGSDIVSACNTLPFASERRLVEVCNGDKLKKADQDILQAYLASPSPTTVLAFSCEKLAKNTRLYKAFAAIGDKAVINCTPMKKFELTRALRSMAVGHGFTLTEQGAQALIELAGEDTVRLDSELRKLALAADGQTPVSREQVESLVARTIEAKPWELVNAVSERDLGKCLVLLGLMEDAPIKLIAMCVTRFRELACAKSLDARGQASSLAQVLGVPAWRVKNHVSWARNYSQAEIKAAFTKARDCERLLKSTSMGQAAFVDWLIAVVSR